MTTAHILGFPRIGANRELKTALESFWRGALPEADLLRVGGDLRARNWRRQREAGMDFVTVGDFAWYDSVLQTLVHLGGLPLRFGFDARALALAQYFTLARGDADHAAIVGASVPGRAKRPGGRILLEQRADHAALHVVDLERDPRVTLQRVLELSPRAWIGARES